MTPVLSGGALSPYGRYNTQIEPGLSGSCRWSDPGGLSEVRSGRLSDGSSRVGFDDCVF